MKKWSLALCCLFVFSQARTQITYIGILNHNTGNGSNNLFNHYVSTGQQCYIDWEVYAEGMNSADNCGDKSVSRLVLRRMGGQDPRSVVASAPIYVPGICGGKNGNNDKFYADLSTYIDRPGRYSVEIQADLANVPDPFESASTRTTFNYDCPSAYYLTGSGGPTGNYYIPSGNCAGGPGLSDPVGNASLDRIPEIFSALKFFTVGEVGTYRQMVILGNQFYDLEQGKFQPGNPQLPASLNGLHGIPATGLCPLSPVPTLSIGAEINNFKRTDCGNADVTGATLFYRVYKEGGPLPAYSPMALDFSDDCPGSPNGPEGNNFPIGGSCQNSNGILDQRWQKINAVANILPTSFALEDTGTWRIDFYLVTYGKNCSGADENVQSGINSTRFTVNNPDVPGSPCSSVIPVRFAWITVHPGEQRNLLNWKVEEALNVTAFEVQYSTDGYRFSSLGRVPFNAPNAVYQFSDAAHPGKTVYYRIMSVEADGSRHYSAIVRVLASGRQPQFTVQALPGLLQIRMQPPAGGTYQLLLFNSAGSLLSRQPLQAAAGSLLTRQIPLSPTFARGIYHAQLRNEKGELTASCSFSY